MWVTSGKLGSADMSHFPRVYRPGDLVFCLFDVSRILTRTRWATPDWRCNDYRSLLRILDV